MSSTPGEVTQILIDLRHGDEGARDRLIPLVYRELRQIAAVRLRGENANHSLQPTTLVHEAYIRLAGMDRIDWQNRAHFFSVASTEMRRILVSHARMKKAEKRNAGIRTVKFDETLFASPRRSPEVLALDDALDKLAQFDIRQAKIVEMRFFAGMSEEETSDVLGISARTVKRDWRIARAWLFKELTAEE